jgi:hypothetical protein
VLYDAARISVAHSSFMEYLLRLSHERYSLLAQWPEFSAMFAKEYYYRWGWWLPIGLNVCTCSKHVYCRWGWWLPMDLIGRRQVQCKDLRLFSCCQHCV